MNRRVGYRFHPTDEELVFYFLKSKLNGIDFDDDIRVVDICNIEPWNLPKYAAQGSNDRVWYFFYRRELKYKRTDKPRYTMTGHWKPTGKKRLVKAKCSRKDIGLKRTLVFCKHGEPKELETNWVIHEYELREASPSKQGDWVVCKLKAKPDGKADASTSREAELSLSGASDSEISPPAVPISQSSQYGDSNLNNGPAISTEYPQMFSVQAVTETLPASRYEQSGTEKKYFNHDEILAMEASSVESIMDRHEKTNCIRESSKKYPAIMMITHQPRSGNKTVKKKKTSTRNQIKVKLSGKYKPKAREAGKHGTDLDLPCKSPKESFAQTCTSKDFQPYSFQEVYERFKAPEQSLCSIQDLQKEIKNIKLSGMSKPKAREDRKHGTDLDLPRKSPKESFVQPHTSKDFQPYNFQEIWEIQDLQEEIKNTKLKIQELEKDLEITKRVSEELMKYMNTQVRNNPEASLSNDKHPHEDFIEAISKKTEKDQKKVTAKPSLKSRTDGMTSNDKICSSIDDPEISLLCQRISTISLYG